MAKPAPRKEGRLLALLLAASCGLLLAVAAAVFWPAVAPPDNDEPMVPRAQMQHAYNRVVPGRSTQPDLVRLGFDNAPYRARILSGLGVQEYFMPGTSSGFDQLDPAVRACFGGADRCRAIVVALPLSVPGGIAGDPSAPSDDPRMVFLLRGGLVVYKEMQNG